MNGNEQTRKNIIAIPQERKESWIKGTKRNRIDSISRILIIGTSMVETLKNGFNLFPFM